MLVGILFVWACAKMVIRSYKEVGAKHFTHLSPRKKNTLGRHNFVRGHFLVMKKIPEYYAEYQVVSIMQKRTREGSRVQLTGKRTWPFYSHAGRTDATPPCTCQPPCSITSAHFAFILRNFNYDFDDSIGFIVHVISIHLASYRTYNLTGLSIVYRRF